MDSEFKIVLASDVINNPEQHSYISTDSSCGDDFILEANLQFGLEPKRVSTRISSKGNRQYKSLLYVGERTKKKEELDKFWLRAFKDYIKRNFAAYCFSSAAEAFWDEYFTEDKVPGIGKEYRSYGKQYKKWLFSHEVYAV